MKAELYKFKYTGYIKLQYKLQNEMSNTIQNENVKRLKRDWNCFGYVLSVYVKINNKNWLIYITQIIFVPFIIIPIRIFDSSVDKMIFRTFIVLQF